MILQINAISTFHLLANYQTAHAIPIFFFQACWSAERGRVSSRRVIQQTVI